LYRRAPQANASSTHQATISRPLRTERLRRVRQSAAARWRGQWGACARSSTRLLDGMTGFVLRLPGITASPTHPQRYWRNATDADRARCRRAQIDDASPHERPAVIDAYHHGASGVSVGNGNSCAKRQSSMGSRHRTRIHAFAVCGATATVNRGHSGPVATLRSANIAMMARGMDGEPSVRMRQRRRALRQTQNA
jgi:hypothetical protein